MSDSSEQVHNFKTSVRCDKSQNDSGIYDVSFDNPYALDYEKDCKALENLNNRFVKYIEHIQQQDLVNNSNKVLENVEVPQTQLENLRRLYESEILHLRDALDKQSNDLASLTIKNNKLLAEKENIQQELKDKSSQMLEFIESLHKIEAENMSLKTQIDVLQANKSLTDNLSNQLKLCQEQLENEVLLRTSSDNACLTYKEKMRFNEAVFKKELGALMITYKANLEKLSSLKTVINSSDLLNQMEISRKKLREYLEDFRNATSDKIIDLIDNVSSSFDNQTNNLMKLKNNNNELTENRNKLIMELEQLKASHIKLENHLSDLETLNENEINRLKTLVHQLSNDKINNLENQFNLFKDVDSSIADKLFLDAELTLYRKMLESEESRINLNDSISTTLRKRKFVSQSNETGNSRKILKATRHNKSCSMM